MEFPYQLEYSINIKNIMVEKNENENPKKRKEIPDYLEPISKKMKLLEIKEISNIEVPDISHILNAFNTLHVLDISGREISKEIKRQKIN